MLEIAAPDFEEVVSGQKKLETFAKDVGTKTIRKQLGVGKKIFSVELVQPDPFPKKLDQKNSRSRRDVFDKIK